MGVLGSLGEGLLELVYPTRCAGCDLPGSVLCDRCRDALPIIDVPTACPVCGAPFGKLVCTECWDRELAFTRGVSVGSLAAPLSRVVTLYKDGGERRLVAEIARLLVSVVEPWLEWIDVVTYVPATEKARRRRGFDHAAEISERVADAVCATHCATLARSRALDQRSLGRTGRFENASGTFSLVTPVRGGVLLIDDVFTTGATLDAAARTLIEGGASEVRAATVARAW